MWNELGNSIKLLISASGKVHTEKMSTINLFQMIGLCGLMASSCFSMCAIKMTAKATVSFVPIAIPCVCRWCLSLNLRTVPTIVIAHTFCASPDTRISYGQCSLIKGYFCVV